MQYSWEILWCGIIYSINSFQIIFIATLVIFVKFAFVPFLLLYINTPRQWVFQCPRFNYFFLCNSICILFEIHIKDHHFSFLHRTFIFLNISSVYIQFLQTVIWSFTEKKVKTQAYQLFSTHEIREYTVSNYLNTEEHQPLSQAWWLMPITHNERKWGRKTAR